MQHPPRFIEIVRVSSTGQAERDSPEDQRRALDALRRTRPGALVERIDSTVSGAKDSDDRADLQRLFALLSAGCDEVRVRHIDRLTRHPDPRQRAAVFGAIMDAGAVVVEASGRVIDPADEMGELDLSLQGWFASRERRRILERTLAAKRRLASQGRMASGAGCCPWGRAFDRQRGVWTLTEAAATYRRLFDLALDGMTLWQIARRLNAEGVPSPRGAAWTGPMVGNRLRAQHAVGRWRSYGHEVEIPPVVDAETFAEVARLLRSHDRSGGARVRHPALLRKILVCGVCGSPCHTGIHRTGSPPFYECSAHDARCYRTHNIAAVDDAVKARLTAWLHDPTALAAGAGAEAEGDSEADTKAAEERLKRAQREEDRAARLAASGGMSERAAEKLVREKGAAVAAAERELEDLRSRARFALRRVEAAATLEERAAQLRTGLGAATFADWRALVEILFSRAAGASAAIWPDGRIELRGAVSLDGSGTAALRGNAAPRSRTPCSIPLRLVARSGYPRSTPRAGARG